MSEGGFHSAFNGGFTKWLLSIIAALLLGLVSVLWDGNAQLAVLDNRLANLEKTFTAGIDDLKDDANDREQRVRRLERLVNQRIRDDERNGL
jgi:hypothetical protein